MHQHAIAADVAAILNAGYLVRHYQRPHQHAERERAFEQLADAARRALARRGAEAAALSAIAAALRE